MKSPPKPLTLGDVSRYCHVDRVTAQRWVKAAQIPAYRTPGGHYRVTKEDFLYFLQKNNMPIYPEFFHDLPRRILIGDTPNRDAEALAGFLKKSQVDYEIRIGSSGCETLILLGQFQPDLLVLNPRMEGLGGSNICEEIKKMFPERPIRIVALFEDDWGEEDILDLGAEECLKKPVNAEDFLKTIQKWIEVSTLPKKQ